MPNDTQCFEKLVPPVLIEVKLTGEEFAQSESYTCRVI